MCNINIEESLNPRSAVVLRLHCTPSFTMTWMRPLSDLGMKLNSPKPVWVGCVSIKGTGRGEVRGEDVIHRFTQARSCERLKRSNMTDQPLQCGGLHGASGWGLQGPAWMVTWHHLRHGSEGGRELTVQSFVLFCDFPPHTLVKAAIFGQSEEQRLL